jgi:hypothetical protein
MPEGLTGVTGGEAQMDVGGQRLQRQPFRSGLDEPATDEGEQAAGRRMEQQTHLIGEDTGPGSLR